MTRSFKSASCVTLVFMVLLAAFSADMEGFTPFARHKVIAQFTGIRKITCTSSTALCPDRCGHSGSYAFFSIKKYLEYLRPDPRGEEKKEIFTIKLDGERKAAGLDERALGLIKNLNPEDHLVLLWVHGKFDGGDLPLPEHFMLGIKRVSNEEAAKLMAD